MNTTLGKSNLSAIHYNNAINDKLIDICAPLFDNFAITHFFYIKIFSNNTCLYLCNDKKWVKHYIENEFQDDPLHFKSYIPDNMNCSLWTGFERDKVYSAVYDFNVWNGFNIYEKQSDAFTTYAFGSTRSNVSISNFYVNNINLLKNFILHFKYKLQYEIDCTDVDKLIISKTKKPQIYNKKWDKFSKFYEQINLKKFPFRGRAEEVYLTEREVMCLCLLADGKTAKEAGQYLRLSPRTIEFYLRNIKRKTGFRTKDELTREFQENVCVNFYEVIKYNKLL